MFAGVDLRVVQEMLGHSSIVLTADTYTSVLPDAAYSAAEKVAALIITAGCLVPGTRRRQAPRRRRPPGKQAGRSRLARRSRAHPAGGSAARTGGAAPGCDDRPQAGATAQRELMSLPMVRGAL